MEFTNRTYATLETKEGQRKCVYSRICLICVAVVLKRNVFNCEYAMHILRSAQQLPNA